MFCNKNALMLSLIGDKGDKKIRTNDFSLLSFPYRLPNL